MCYVRDTDGEWREFNADLATALLDMMDDPEMRGYMEGTVIAFVDAERQPQWVITPSTIQ